MDKPQHRLSTANIISCREKKTSFFNNLKILNLQNHVCIILIYAFIKKSRTEFPLYRQPGTHLNRMIMYLSVVLQNGRPINFIGKTQHPRHSVFLSAVRSTQTAISNGIPLCQLHSALALFLI